jgi:hypothetical protein
MLVFPRTLFTNPACAGNSSGAPYDPHEQSPAANMAPVASAEPEVR